MTATQPLTPPATPGPPLWLLAELTYRCPLHCVFCYNPIDFARQEEELGTDDWLRVLRQGIRPDQFCIRVCVQVSKPGDSAGASYGWPQAFRLQIPVLRQGKTENPRSATWKQCTSRKFAKATTSAGSTSGSPLNTIICPCKFVSSIKTARCWIRPLPQFPINRCQ